MKKFSLRLGAVLAILLPGVAVAETVKVGVIGVFSGGFARWGEQFQQAIEVYQKQNGKIVNGHTIEVVYRDAGGADPAKSRQLAEELILREKIQFLGGFAFTPNALAVAQLVTESKTPTVIFNAATAMVTRRSPYFVRVSFTLPQVTAPVAIWAAKSGIKKVVSVVTDYAPGHDAEATFVKVFKANGGEILETMRIPLPTTDFAPFFERVLAHKPDAMFMFGPGGPSSIGMINTWASRLKPAGIQLITTNETQEIDLPKFGRAAIDVIGSSHYTEVSEIPLNKRFRADLTAMFGADRVPDVASIQAYDAIHLIYMTVAKLGPRPNPDEVVKFWTSGLKWDSPRGPVAIDPKERDIIQGVHLRRVKEVNGKLINVDFQVVPEVKDPWKEENPS